MGLDESAAMLLCAAKSLGVDFSETATIGRQTFWPGAPALRRVFATLGINLDAKAFIEGNKFADEFFKLLGAKAVQSVDFSSYEEATILLDMNLPLSKQWHGKFSMVFDGGSIEHVFNIPQAFKNCMELVKVGGHFTQVNCANNCAGHGFWQFSPELIFRIFSPANGFELVAVLMREVAPAGPWHLVSDPEKMRKRVELVNDKPTYIMAIAKRIAEVEIFKVPPQQSDYVSMWDQAVVKHGAGAPSWKNCVPKPLKNSIKKIKKAIFEPAFDPKLYRRIDDDAVLRGILR